LQLQIPRILLHWVDIEYIHHYVLNIRYWVVYAELSGVYKCYDQLEIEKQHKFEYRYK